MDIKERRNQNERVWCSQLEWLRGLALNSQLEWLLALALNPAGSFRILVGLVTPATDETCSFFSFLQ